MDKLKVSVTDKEILDNVDLVVRFRNELEKYLHEKANKELWKSYNYNFCNHCAIGLAYYLNKVVSNHSFTAHESNLIPNDSLDYDTVLPEYNIIFNERMFNHAYVIGCSKETNNKVIIDMERYPLWFNIIKDISEEDIFKGNFFKNIKEVNRTTYNLNKCLNDVDFLTSTKGKDLFDEVIRRCSE